MERLSREGMYPVPEANDPPRHLLNNELALQSLLHLRG